MATCIQAEITWRAEPGDIPGSWVGFCDDLGITIEASSRDELRSLAMESMKSVIGNLLEEGELEDFLRFKGVTYSKEEGETASKFHALWKLITTEQHDFEQAVA